MRADPRVVECRRRRSGGGGADRRQNGGLGAEVMGEVVEIGRIARIIACIP